MSDFGIDGTQRHFFDGLVLSFKARSQDEPIYIKVLVLSTSIFEISLDLLKTLLAVLKVQFDEIKRVLDVQISASGRKQFFNRREIEVVRNEDQDVDWNVMLVDLFVEELETRNLCFLD